MDANQIRELGRVVIAAAGCLSIYLGYRLFCDASFRMRRSLVFANVVCGGALALFGMGLLVADLRGMAAPDSAEFTRYRGTGAAVRPETPSRW
ncbi:MAG TPA: hypothetical protein VHB50_07605, partial [Bryobacteraceae bacterium]|nr:hypothetical protein [Bryobacteraceae bacterium]